MNLVYWDTMLFIYWLEDHPVFAPQVEALRRRMSEKGDRLCTSAFSLAEVLVGPYKRKQPQLAAAFRDFFRPPTVDLLPFSAGTAERYAQLRAESGIAPPDAIHLATAAEAGVDLFVTNDSGLRNLVVPGIRFITGLDLRLS